MFLMLVLIVMIVDLIIPFFIAIPYKNYSHTKMLMSVLGCRTSPLGWLYSFWMVVSGCVMVLFGYNLFNYYKEIQFSLGVMLFVLFVIYGVCDEVVSGFFPLNEKKEDVTLSSQIHIIGSTIGAFALQLAPLVLGILQFITKQTVLGIYSIVSFSLSLIAGVFYLLGENPKYKNTIFALGGLWQRVMHTLHYAPFLIWIIERL